MFTLEVGQQGLLVGRGRVTDRQAHQETVELGFGQREGALILDRVLGGHHQEWARQRMRDAVHRDLLFLHGFQQGGLGTRGGAVNFVGEQDVDKNRTAAEFELTGLLVKDRNAGHIIGQEVGGALQALELPAQADGNGARQHGFPYTGNILDQDMAVT